MSMLTYRDQATTHQLQNLIRRGDRTKLTAFFNLCARDPEGTDNLLTDGMIAPTHEHRTKNFSDDDYKSIPERDRQNNIERDEEIRLPMAEYICLKWVA
ncbi:Helitron helicase, partial [Phytophthora megakarya]